MLAVRHVCLLLGLLGQLIPRSSPSVRSLLFNKEDNHFVLDFKVHSQSYKLNAYLDSQRSWIRSVDCQKCQSISNCEPKGSCSDVPHSGFKCESEHCESNENEKNKGIVLKNSEWIFDGKSVVLKVKQQNHETKIPIVLAIKMDRRYDQVGRFNILDLQGLFEGCQVLLFSEDESQIEVRYICQQNLSVKKSSKHGNKEEDDSDSALTAETPSSVELKTTPELISGIKTIGQPIIISGEHYSHSMVSQNDLNSLHISQIRLINSDPKSGKSSVVTELPSMKSNAKISLSTNKLLLPEKYYDQLMKHIATAYLEKCEDQQQNLEISNELKGEDRCIFPKQSVIQCRQSISLQKMEAALIELTLNSLQVEFPLRALVVSCTKNSCQFLIGVSRHRQTVLIGRFILTVFTVKYSVSRSDKTVKFHRLDNQWGQLYQSPTVYKNRKEGFLRNLFYLIFKMLWWTGKAILCLALFSVGLNCLYRWRDVMEWFMNINSRLKEKKHQQKLKSVFEGQGRFRDPVKLISSNSADDWEEGGPD